MRTLSREPDNRTTKTMQSLENQRQRIQLSNNPDDPQHYVHDDWGLAVEESKPELKPPAMYKVIMMNDDYTPMDFVVEVLEQFFAKTREQATQIMLTVHTKGQAVCGIFSRDVAETKAMQVNQYARESHHPLLCEIEKDV